jgi:hypothetical protein
MTVPDKDPSAWTIATWLLALGMGFSGGVVHWWARMKSRKPRVFSLMELVGEIFTSGFVGVWGVHGPECSGTSQPACVRQPAGSAGHMGARLLFVLERAAEARLKAYLGEDDA